VSELEGLFVRTRAEGRAAFLPYLTAGDPSLEATERFAQALVEGGADCLELGVPFSDPLADGPVIQRACQRSLAAGTRLGDVLECAARIHEKTKAPIVLMSYLNPVLRYDWGRLNAEAPAAGIAGIILTDVPPEEARPYLPAARRSGLSTIFLVAPTSDLERVRKATEVARGFLYCVSRLGVTGKRESLSEAFRPVLMAVRELSDIPVGLGFGISSAEQAREAGSLADAVIVGSALVALAEEAGSVAKAALVLAKAAREFRGALASRN
jgi:tryptophan synthase alpha chain